MKFEPFILLFCLIGLLSCKQDKSTTDEQSKRVSKEKISKTSDKAKAGNRQEREEFGSRNLMRDGERGNVIHVPPPTEKVNYENAFRIIYDGLLTKTDKVGQLTSMSMFTFNASGTQIREYNRDEIIGLANALKDKPDVKIQIQSHSRAGLDITHSRANAVKQLLIENGAPPNQISSMGKGKENKAKAAGDLISVKLLEM